MLLKIQIDKPVNDSLLTEELVTTGASFVLVDRDDGYIEITTSDPAAAIQAYQAHDHTQVSEEEQRTSQARARWLASQLAGKTSEQAYVLVENALTGASTVAEMRQVLIQLLPIIGAGVVYLARSLEE